MPRSTFLFIVLAAAVVLISGCRSTLKYIPKQDSNPPPAESFSQFSSYDQKIIILGRQCKKSNEVMTASMAIQRQLDEQLPKLIADWKSSASSVSTTSPSARTLRIAPACFAVVRGQNPGILMKVRYTDVTTGTVIAEPSFYQSLHSAETQDVANRLTTLIMEYTRANYAAAVGGPTGSSGSQLNGIEAD